MKKKILIPLAAIATIVGVFFAARQETPYERGRAEARADLEAGRPRYFYVGEPLSADSRLREILKQDYNITFVGIGCSPVPPVHEHATGYNEIVSDILGKRFGEDFIKNALDKDLALPERSYKKNEH